MQRDLRAAASRLGAAGAWLGIVGILVSGPLGLVLVSLTHPMPAWTNAEAFAHNFHWVHTVHFFGGLGLLSAS